MVRTSKGKRWEGKPYHPMLSYLSPFAGVLWEKGYSYLDDRISGDSVGGDGSSDIIFSISMPDTPFSFNLLLLISYDPTLKLIVENDVFANCVHQAWKLR